jgi:hypothetical protein
MCSSKLCHCLPQRCTCILSSIQVKRFVKKKKWGQERTSILRVGTRSGPELRFSVNRYAFFHMQNAYFKLNLFRLCYLLLPAPPTHTAKRPLETKGNFNIKRKLTTMKDRWAVPTSTSRPRPTRHTNKLSLRTKTSTNISTKTNTRTDPTPALILCVYLASWDAEHVLELGETPVEIIKYSKLSSSRSTK